MLRDKNLCYIYHRSKLIFIEVYMTSAQEIERRRTFAIISHPDAGKTTLTEKLLLYSGLLHTAGVVRARKGRKSAVSDWMSMEQERGISITASAMQFPYKGAIVNVLDTPGHADFSVDTYRTLTAADCAIMVIDAAKGVEKQTRKLFEACRLRKIPVLTLINKMDMPARMPLDLMDEVEKVLGIQASPLNWPIGTGSGFCGVYDVRQQKVLRFSKQATGGALKAEVHAYELNDPVWRGTLQQNDIEQLTDDLELLGAAGNPFSRETFLQGNVTPVFFASALTNFGVEPFFDAFIELAPMPRAYPADTWQKKEEIAVDPIKTPFSGYVFKLQANMDRRHRDSMAFIRICSGKFEKDMVVRHHRLQREVRLSRPHGMVAGERTTVDEAYAGDILGVINPGVFTIGDTISLSGGFDYKPLPQFQPEIFARLQPKDIGKRKSFDKGVQHLADEGAVQLLYPKGEGTGVIFAVVGQLQFEVMQYRLRDEYGVETLLTPLPYKCSAWLQGSIETFQKTTGSLLAEDRMRRPIVLFPDIWDREYTEKQNPQHQLVDMIA